MFCGFFFLVSALLLQKSEAQTPDFTYINCDDASDRNDVYINEKSWIECQKRRGRISERLTRCIIRDNPDGFEYISVDAFNQVLSHASMSQTKLGDLRTEEACNQLTTHISYQSILTIVGRDNVVKITIQNLRNQKAGAQVTRKVNGQETFLVGGNSRPQPQQYDLQVPQTSHLDCRVYQNANRKVYVDVDAWLECVPNSNGRQYDQRLTRCIVNRPDHGHIEYIDRNALVRLLNENRYRFTDDAQHETEDSFCNKLRTVDDYYNKIIDCLGSDSIISESVADFLNNGHAGNSVAMTFLDANRNSFEYQTGDDFTNRQLNCQNHLDSNNIRFNQNAWIECGQSYETVTRCVIQETGPGEFEYVDIGELECLSKHRAFFGKVDDSSDDALCNGIVNTPGSYQIIHDFLGPERIYQTSYQDVHNNRNQARITKWNGYKLQDLTPHRNNGRLYVPAALPSRLQYSL